MCHAGDLCSDVPLSCVDLDVAEIDLPAFGDEWCVSVPTRQRRAVSELCVNQRCLSLSCRRIAFLSIQCLHSMFFQQCLSLLCRRIAFVLADADPCVPQVSMVCCLGVCLSRGVYNHLARKQMYSCMILGMHSCVDVGLCVYPCVCTRACVRSGALCSQNPPLPAGPLQWERIALPGSIATVSPTHPVRSCWTGPSQSRGPPSAARFPSMDRARWAEHAVVALHVPLDMGQKRVYTCVCACMLKRAVASVCT